MDGAVSRRVLSPPPEDQELVVETSLRYINNEDPTWNDPDWLSITIPELQFQFNATNFYVLATDALIKYRVTDGKWLLRSIRCSYLIVVAVVKMVLSSDDREAMRCAADIFLDFSISQEGLFAIYNVPSVMSLVKLLNSYDKHTSLGGVRALTNLLTYRGQAEVVVRLAGGVHVVAALLERRNEEYLTEVTRLLEIMVLQDEESKLILFDCGGCAALLRLMLLYTNGTLLSQARTIFDLTWAFRGYPPLLESNELPVAARGTISISRGDHDVDVANLFPAYNDM